MAFGIQFNNKIILTVDLHVIKSSATSATGIVRGDGSNSSWYEPKKRRNSSNERISTVTLNVAWDDCSLPQENTDKTQTGTVKMLCYLQKRGRPGRISHVSNTICNWVVRTRKRK